MDSTEFEDKVTEKVKSQMKQGKRGDGSVIDPPYRPKTIAIKNKMKLKHLATGRTAEQQQNWLFKVSKSVWQQLKDLFTERELYNLDFKVVLEDSDRQWAKNAYAEFKKCLWWDEEEHFANTVLKHAKQK